MDLIRRVERMVEEVRREFAPDPRLAVYEIGVEGGESRLTLIGATSEPAAAEALHQRVATLDADVEVRDAVQRLPAEWDGDLIHAVVSAAAAPMLAGPGVAETHISQALLGHHLLVLRQRGRWLHCRARDGYLGWVHRGYVRRVEETDARGWEMGTEGEACLSLGAQVLDPAGDVMARLPWGARFVRRADGLAMLPDGSTGQLSGEYVALRERAQRFVRTGAAVAETAQRWLGAPYLWGGTTPDGVDCSGLMQAVYRTHGVELPRDSDQQARSGEAVDPGPDFADLLPGDLLFFAEEPGRITHVTMSLGGSRIVHSSLGNGGVRRNDLQGSFPYEEELRELYVCARRVIPAEPGGAAPPAGAER